MDGVKNSATKIDAETPSLTSQHRDADKKLRKVCADFETIFTSYLLKTMRKTVSPGLTVNQFAGKDTYDMMMDQKIAEELSKRQNGIGLQKVLYDQLVKRNNPLK